MPQARDRTFASRRRVPETLGHGCHSPVRVTLVASDATAMYQTRTYWKLATAEDAEPIKARLDPKLVALGLTYHWWQSGPMYPGHRLDHSLLLVIEWRDRAEYEVLKLRHRSAILSP